MSVLSFRVHGSTDHALNEGMPVRSLPGVSHHMEPFDLRAALAAVTPLMIPYSIGIDSPATEKTLNRLELLMYEATGGLKGDKLTELVPFLVSLLAEDETYTAAALEQQRQGVLADCDRRIILRGATIGAFAATAPSRFLLETHWPELQGPDRPFFGAVLYAMHLVTSDTASSTEPGQSLHTALELRRLALSVGVACRHEIVSRLAQHTSSRDVFEFVSSENGAALQRLLGLVRANTRDLPPDVMDSPSSALWLAIDAHVRSALPISLVGKDSDLTDPSTRTHVVLYLAMGGELDHIPTEVRMDWIDELRQQSAHIRGGDGEHRPILKPLTAAIEQQCVTSWETSAAPADRVKHDTQPELTAQPKRARGANPTEPSQPWHTSEEIWRTITYEGWSVKEFENRFRDLRAGSKGFDAKFLDWWYEHADDEQRYTKEDVAIAIGSTVKTVFNIEQRLKKLASGKRPIH